MHARCAAFVIWVAAALLAVAASTEFPRMDDGRPDFSGAYDNPEEYACHEGSYSLANTLRGARALERQWIERHGPPGGAEE